MPCASAELAGLSWGPLAAGALLVLERATAAELTSVIGPNTTLAALAVNGNHVFKNARHQHIVVMEAIS